LWPSIRAGSIARDNGGMIPPLPNEAGTLRPMLGIEPPVLLDIKPPDRASL